MLFSLKDDKVIKIRPKFVNNNNKPSIVLEITFGTGGIFSYEIKNERQLNYLVEWFMNLKNYKQLLNLEIHYLMLI